VDKLRHSAARTGRAGPEARAAGKHGKPLAHHIF